MTTHEIHQARGWRWSPLWRKGRHGGRTREQFLSLIEAQPKWPVLRSRVIAQLGNIFIAAVMLLAFLGVLVFDARHGISPGNAAIAAAFAAIAAGLFGKAIGALLSDRD